MKFGKFIQKRQLEIPEYAASFVNYKALKKLIKQLSATPIIHAQSTTDPTTEALDPRALLQANKATFFFKLERELEKVNAFYLQKEAELQLRLKTLLDKKRMIQARSSANPKLSANFVTLEEGFQQFGGDLGKLQQFIEINGTAFSKILKKWDKTSKSRTKELYLSRAVEVQPCFNRDVISDLSDQATSNLLELGAWAEGEGVQNQPSRLTESITNEQSIDTDEGGTDAQILHAASTGNLVLLSDWISRLRETPAANERFTRVFLTGITDCPDEALNVLLNSGQVNIHAQDGINERNCIHEAAINGRESVVSTAISRGVDVTRRDTYGRLPLHYACMYGHVGMVQKLLDTEPSTVDERDHDNFSPLIHAIVHSREACVRQLLIYGTRIDPTNETDHVPLNLACQHGSTDIVRLLLEKNVQLLPDAEGLYPQHLVARSGGNPRLLKTLEDYGADLDQRDKLYQWTPLFHAAAEGHQQCMQLLLDQSVDSRILDEKGLSSLYYATWEGHLACMMLLIAHHGEPQETKADVTHHLPLKSTMPVAKAGASDNDGIPSLSLPPPIIPIRRYGHSFLDTKTLVQLTFESQGSNPIQLYQDSKFPAARLTISSKISDMIPRNIMLPIQEDSRNVTLQIEDLDALNLDFDIYPTFGSRIIARGVALSHLFGAAQGSSAHFCVPLFDPRLRTTGQISFTSQVIRPFQGVPLEVSEFATYWKATSQANSRPSALITGSSLSGDYVHLRVQLTKDGAPVVYPARSLNFHGISIPVDYLTLGEFLSIGRQSSTSRNLTSLPQRGSSEDVNSIQTVLSQCHSLLDDVLDVIPAHVHINIEVLHLNGMQTTRERQRSSTDINIFVDTILDVVFKHSRKMKEHNPEFMRSIVFTSYSAEICTALNWKQPNYPVLLRNNLGSDVQIGAPNTSESSGNAQSSMSIKEAVRIAQENNFMGLVCNLRLLRLVPALIETIKVAGLVLVADTSGLPLRSQDAQRKIDGIDGLVRSDGILHFNETIDM